MNIAIYREVELALQHEANGMVYVEVPEDWNLRLLALAKAAVDMPSLMSPKIIPTLTPSSLRMPFCLPA